MSSGIVRQWLVGSTEMSAWEQSVGRRTLKSYLFEEVAGRPIKMILHVVYFDIGLSRWPWNRFALAGHPSLRHRQEFSTSRQDNIVNPKSYTGHLKL